MYSYYIAFGDSFVSGIGASRLRQGDKCGISDLAWPVLVDEALGHQPFAFAACSGATTRDVIGNGPLVENGTQAGPQIDLLPSPEQLESALITIAIGGNDAKLDDRLRRCLQLSSPNGLPSAGTLPPECLDMDQVLGEADEIIRESLGDNLDQTFKALRDAAPTATILAVGYPHIFDTVNPACELMLTGRLLTRSQREKVNQIVDAVNEQIKQSAKNAMIDSVTDKVVAAFRGHEACATDEWIVSPDTALATLNFGVTHPNDRGYRVYADAVLSALRGL